MKKRKYGDIIAVVLLTVILFAGFWGTWSTINNLLGTPATTASGSIALTIRENETTQQIADELQQKGLINNALLFRLWARLQGLDTKLQAGVYNLAPGQSIDAIIAKLQDGKPDAKSLTVISGMRLEEIVNRADSLGLSGFSKQDFLNYTHHPDQFPDKAKYPLLNNLPTMEGLLYPDTYSVPTNATTVQMIDQMLDDLNQFIKDNDLVAKAQKVNLTTYQMIILASIVQREASNTQQMPLIAGIYWKRINQPSSDVGGPVLQSDPTVEYAYDTDNPPNLQAGGYYWKDLNKYGTGSTVDTGSLWNTYTHPGWTPTPISSPGPDALNAAASPAPTNCYYFFTKPSDGSLMCEPTYRLIQIDEQKYLH